MGKGRIGHFSRFNELAANGWTARLTRNELAMWIAYERRADVEGYAYPSGQELAQAIGHASDKHVGRLRANLVRYGLLAIVGPTQGGRGHRLKVQVLTPPKPPKSGSVSAGETPPSRGGFTANKPPQTGTQTPPNWGDKPPQTGARHNKEELPNKHTNKQPSEIGPESLVEDWHKLAMLPHLRTGGFFEAWGSWLAYVHERTGRDLPTITARMQLATLGKGTLQEAVATIRHSMESNYVSLRPPDKPGTSKRKAERDEFDRFIDGIAGSIESHDEGTRSKAEQVGQGSVSDADARAG